MRLAWISAVVLAATAAAAQAPSPALLVVNKEGSLAIVDPASRKLVATVRTGDTPHEVAVSANGRLAFVSNYGGAAPGNTISVIDLAARMEVRRVDLGPLRRPHGLAFAGGKLYFTAEMNRLIGRYDPAADRIDFLLGTGQATTHMIMVSPDLNHIYTANIGSDSISVIDADGVQNWREKVIPVGLGPEGFDISPDGKQLWAADSRDGGMSIIDLYSRRVVRTFHLGTKRSNRLKFTPDGRLVLISDLDAGELVVLERETLNEVKRMKLGHNPAGILITPDSTRAYVAVTGDNDVAEIDLRGLELKALIKTGAGPDGMAWVP
jgi:YVTN family beta-propeller protein